MAFLHNHILLSSRAETVMNVQGFVGFVTSTFSIFIHEYRKLHGYDGPPPTFVDVPALHEFTKVTLTYWNVPCHMHSDQHGIRTSCARPALSSWRPNLAHRLLCRSCRFPSYSTSTKHIAWLCRR